jgi:hypothetical protein
MGSSCIAHGLCPEIFGLIRPDMSRARYLKEGVIRTLSYVVDLERVRYRAVYGYIATACKLGNRIILSSVVGVNGIYLRLLTTLKLA